MPALYYEDFEVGARFKTQGRTIGDTEVTLFVGIAGVVEELFSNIEYIRSKSIFKQRVVPGPLVFATAEGLFSQTGLLNEAALAMLGVDEMRWQAPVFVGDTIWVESEVLSKRESSAKPDRGIVQSVQRVTNQKGEEVLSFKIARMIAKRHASVPSA